MSDSERKITAPIIFGKFLNLLIVWLSVVAFLIGVILPFLGIIFPANANTTYLRVIVFLQSNTQSNWLIYLLKIVLVLFIAALLLTIVIPIPWMLIDSQLKGYLAEQRVNFFVGSQLQQRLASLFAIGGLLSLVLTNFTLDFIIAFLVFTFLFVSLPAVIVTFLYNFFFQVSHYQVFMQEIPVPYGNTQVVMETKTNSLSSKPSTENIPFSSSQQTLEEKKSSKQCEL